MQEELEKEKRSLMASWKRRQKLIDGVLANTTEMYGSLQGIAGNAISHIEALELPYSGEEDEKDYGSVDVGDRSVDEFSFFGECC